MAIEQLDPLHRNLPLLRQRRVRVLCDISVEIVPLPVVGRSSDGIDGDPVPD